MKFYERYTQLKRKSFLSKILTDTVYSTMVLEAQKVPRVKVVKIVEAILSERESEGNQFFSNEPS